MPEASSIEFPGSVRTVAIFGGSFDPPTRAHVQIPIAVRDAIGADLLLVIPAAVSPFKPDGAGATDKQRLQMLELAFADHRAVAISSIELDRGGPSYTVETLEAIRRDNPGVALRLIIGADNATNFHRWRRPQRILDLAEPAVMLRGDEDPDALIDAMALHWTEPECRAWRERIVSTPTIDASSTEVRALLASTSPDEARLGEMLDPRVLGYIRSEGLYRSSDEGESSG